MKYNPQFENKYSISIISWIRKLMPSWGMHDLCNIASYLAPNPGFDGLSFKFNFISVFSITPLLKMEKAKQLLNVSLLGVLSFFLFSLVLNYYFFFFCQASATWGLSLDARSLCPHTTLFGNQEQPLFVFLTRLTLLPLPLHLWLSFLAQQLPPTGHQLSTAWNPH